MVSAEEDDGHGAGEGVDAELFSGHERDQHVVGAHAEAEEDGKDVDVWAIRGGQRKSSGMVLATRKYVATMTYF